MRIDGRACTYARQTKADNVPRKGVLDHPKDCGLRVGTKKFARLMTSQRVVAYRATFATPSA